jgi:hypothetical protein
MLFRPGDQKMRRQLLSLLLPATSLLFTGAAPMRWGADGHEIIGLAAATKLPMAMPAFFRAARAELGYLNYEADRWRSDNMPEVNEAYRYDHYIDLENVPDSALAAQDRYEYYAILLRSGMAMPERDAGFLPWAIMERYERLVIEFRLWRAATDPARKSFIERRIINDAGILGHFVADGSNPHHTTVHFNGWGAQWPNPRHFTLDQTFHARFESEYLKSHISLDDVLPAAVAPVRTVTELRPAVLEYIRTTNSRVERLYELELQQPFGAGTTDPAHKAFTVERLAAGATMLRDLWWSAWEQSAAS